MIWFHTIPLNQCIQILSQYPGIVIPNKLCPYTLLGMYQSGEMLNLMPGDTIPAEYVLNETESDFDYYYWKELKENPIYINEKLKILNPEYMDGANTIIAIQTDMSTQFSRSITESLIGHLQVFYGVEPKLITCNEDITPDILHYSNFSIEGLYRMSLDTEIMLGYRRGD